MKEKLANKVARVTSTVLNTILGDGVVVAEDHLRKVRHTAI
jgi:hypothetical protein